MRLLIFILCFISNIMCAVCCKDNEISVSISKSDPKCTVNNSCSVELGGNVNAKIYLNNNPVKVKSISMYPESMSNNVTKMENTAELLIRNLTSEQFGNWVINIQKQNEIEGKWYSCNTIIKRKLQNMITSEICLPILVPVLSVIIIAQTCVLVYLICKVRKLQEQEKEKYIDDRPDSAESEVRYISDPVKRNKMIIPDTESDDIDIYCEPEIKTDDQGTLKSNLSVAQRPRMPLPDEEEAVYLEPGEVLKPPPPAFEMSGRSKPIKKIDIVPEKQLKPIPTPKEPAKPKITSDMLNRFRPQENQLSPNPLRKNQLKSTLGRKEPLPDAPGQLRNNELKSTLGRKGVPLLEPPGQVRSNEQKSTVGRKGVPLPEFSGTTRINEPISTPFRNNEPKAHMARNNAVPTPPAQYPIPGPSNWKNNTLKPNVQMPVMPVPGPNTLKKPLKPVPIPNRPMPPPTTDHHVTLPNRPVPPSVVKPVPVPPRPKSPQSLAQAVQYFNKQRELDKFPTPADDNDDEFETYEPLDPRNLYSV